MDDNPPASVRYVKNGMSGQWWRAAKTNGQVHLGWKDVPSGLLLSGDFPVIEKELRSRYGPGRGATRAINELHDLIDAPSKHLWLTFEDGYMWWCTVHDGAIVNPDGESSEKGNSGSFATALGPINR
jgi:hypothetical protein